MRNHIQPSGFALVLYVVTALVHYIPYSTSRGVLTITWEHGDNNTKLLSIIQITRIAAFIHAYYMYLSVATIFNFIVLHSKCV